MYMYMYIYVCIYVCLPVVCLCNRIVTGYLSYFTLGQCYETHVQTVAYTHATGKEKGKKKCIKNRTMFDSSLNQTNRNETRARMHVRKHNNDVWSLLYELYKYTIYMVFSINTWHTVSIYVTKSNASTNVFNFLQLFFRDQ